MQTIDNSYATIVAVFDDPDSSIAYDVADHGFGFNIADAE